MCGSECVGNLDANQEGAFQLKRMAAHKLAHIATFDVLHGDEVNSFNFIEVEYSADVWMIERRGESCLAFKALQVCFSCSQLGRQNFNDHRAAEFSIGGFVNCALPADAELLEDLIIAQKLSDHILCKASSTDFSLCFRPKRTSSNLWH